MAVCSLEVVAYYYGCSSSHNSGYLSNLSPDSDSDSGTCSDMYYLHNVPVVANSVDTHTVLALLSSVSTDNPQYCVTLHKTRRSPKDYSESHSLYLAASIVVVV